MEFSVDGVEAVTVGASGRERLDEPVCLSACPEV